MLSALDRIRLADLSRQPIGQFFDCLVTVAAN
jgi:hypothetical protein